VEGVAAGRARGGGSAGYLTASGQVADLEFAPEHVDDVGAADRLREGEVVEVPGGD
jgi:hypothetical protein